VKKETRDAQQVLREIREMHAAGQKLNTAAVKGSSLYYAAGKYFGGWRKALEAAGLDTRAILAQQTWDEQKVLDQIREIAAAGRPLNRSSLAHEERSLVEAALRRFGGWVEALRAAGVEPKGIAARGSWSAQRVVAEIRARKERGDSLLQKDVRRENPHLVDAARFHIGAWSEALKRAGVDERDIRATRRWTETDVISALQNRIANGQSLTARAVIAEDSGLHRAALRRFGSWQKAVEAARRSTAADKGGENA